MGLFRDGIEYTADHATISASDLIILIGECLKTVNYKRLIFLIVGIDLLVFYHLMALSTFRNLHLILNYPSQPSRSRLLY